MKVVLMVVKWVKRKVDKRVEKMVDMTARQKAERTEMKMVEK